MNSANESDFSTKREKLRLEIRRKRNEAELQEKRKQYMLMLKRFNSTLPKDFKLKNLFQLSFELNRLNAELENVLEIMFTHWEAKKYQSCFLIILSNILEGEVDEEMLGEIVKLVEDKLEPDFGSTEFIATISVFCKAIFRRHSEMDLEYQMIVQNRFLPIIKIALTSTDKRIKSFLIEAIQHMAEYQNIFESVKTDQVLRRNYRAIQMIIDQHHKLLKSTERNASLELACLNVYKHWTESSLTKLDMMYKEETINIFKQYIEFSDKQLAKATLDVIERMCKFKSIKQSYQNNVDLRQSKHLYFDEFMTQYFLPFALSKQIQVWLQVILNLATNNPNMLRSFQKPIILAFIELLKSNIASSDNVLACLKVLNHLLKCQLNQINYMVFEEFEMLNGFMLLEQEIFRKKQLALLNEIEEILLMRNHIVSRIRQKCNMILEEQ